MLSLEEIKQYLYLDIETAPVVRTLEELTPVQQKHWERRAKRQYDVKDDPEALRRSFIEWGGIAAEYGRIVCISCGYFAPGDDLQFRVKSYYGPDEKQILIDFSEALYQLFEHMPRPKGLDLRKLCGHNIKEFDYPFIGRRLLINRLPLPSVFQTQGRKPWDTPLQDTMELWKFGDYKSFSALELLADLLGVPSPKDGMDGSQVGEAFWERQAYDDIAHYCSGDVAAVAQLLLALGRYDLLLPEQIHFV